MGLVSMLGRAPGLVFAQQASGDHRQEAARGLIPEERVPYGAECNGGR